MFLNCVKTAISKPFTHFLLTLRVMFILFAIISFTACKKEYSEVFDIDELKEIAAEAVLIINEKSWDEIRSLSSQEFKEQFTDDFISLNLEPVFAVAGKYKFTRNSFFTESSDEKNSRKTGIVIVRTKYENKTVHFTFNFNEKKELCGMFIY